MEVLFVKAADLHEGLAYGVKGVGDLATIPTAPAIAGAYYALDGKLRAKLPIEDSPYAKRK
jgi:CO/xanthine dehydrogenase Mo-binding subunit